MKASKLLMAAVTLAFLLPALSLLAQGPPAGPPSGPSSSGAPIDGGAILLVASAAAYGYRRLKKANAKIKEQIAVCESVTKDK